MRLEQGFEKKAEGAGRGEGRGKQRLVFVAQPNNSTTVRPAQCQRAVHTAQPGLPKARLVASSIYDMRGQ